jgi:hypothetical protein
MAALSSLLLAPECQRLNRQRLARVDYTANAASGEQSHPSPSVAAAKITTIR